MHTTSIRLPDEIKKTLDEIADFQDRKPHWIMVKAIEKYLAEEMKEMRFLRDAEQNYQDMKNNGSGVTLEAFGNWVDKRERGEPCELPVAQNHTHD